MIHLQRATVHAGGFALREVSLLVPTGRHALVIGPTGSGKSTLLDAVAGHARLTTGSLHLHGIDATHLPPEQRGIGIVHQHYLLFPHLTVGQNIAYGLRAWPADDVQSRVAALAAMLGIGALLHRTPAGLSGGEQQRSALARALAPRPRVLLLDEPFAAVDPATRRVLRRELQTLHAHEGTTTLQVTHDFEDALQLGDEVTVLAEGRVVQQGPPEEVFRRPNSAFVASFTGAGTVLAGIVTRTGDGTDGRFPATFVSGPLVIAVVAEREGAAHAVIRPDDVVLSALPPATSARNAMRGSVLRIERSGGLLLVTVDVGVPVTASIMAASAEALGLVPGLPVCLTFKATAVHLV